MSNKKPIGVTLISIYSAFSGVVSLLGGVGILLLSAMPDIPLSITLLGLALTALGVFLLASVYGLWSLQTWGRNMAKWLYIISIPLGIVAVLPLFSGEEITSSDTLTQIINIGIAAIIIWYLSKPSIRELYEA